MRSMSREVKKVARDERHVISVAEVYSAKGGGVPRRFFFQEEDGIRDTSVTGVQTCALPISRAALAQGRWLEAHCAKRCGIDEMCSASARCASSQRPCASAALAASRPEPGASAPASAARRSEERRGGEGGSSEWAAQDGDKAS